MRQIAATRRHDWLLQQIASCDVKINVAAKEYYRCDLSQRQSKREQPYRSSSDQAF